VTDIEKIARAYHKNAGVAASFEKDRVFWMDEAKNAEAACRRAGYAIVPRTLSYPVAYALEFTEQDFQNPETAGSSEAYLIRCYQPIWDAALSAGEVKP